jgi:hypothetical protein
MSHGLPRSASLNNPDGLTIGELQAAIGDNALPWQDSPLNGDMTAAYVAKTNRAKMRDVLPIPAFEDVYAITFGTRSSTYNGR